MAQIEVDGIRKCYRLSRERPMLVKQLLVHPFRRTSYVEELWALDGVGFELERGATLGIIGPNGSGKSTLLKIISGVTAPTEGRLVVNGRVGSLLELGAGFHPDLTGRENIYLMGAMMGASRSHVDRVYADIVDFSGLGHFVESPVRQYSWGMYVRLAFSVTVHVDFDFLVVDEVLAVGDYAFQLKCFKAIAELKRRGVTLLLVSHNLGAVRNACERCIFLYQGKVVTDGPVEDTIRAYVKFTNEKALADGRGLEGSPEVRDETAERELAVTGVRMLGADGLPAESFETGRPLRFEISYRAARRIERANFQMYFYGNDGLLYAAFDSLWDGVELECPEGEGVVAIDVDQLALLPGTYRITAAVSRSDTLETFDTRERAYSIQVVSPLAMPGQGMAYMGHRWRFHGPRERSSGDAKE